MECGGCVEGDASDTVSPVSFAKQGLLAVQHARADSSGLEQTSKSVARSDEK